MKVFKFHPAAIPILICALVPVASGAPAGGKILALHLHQGKDHQWLSLKFENVGPKPIRVWTDGCSWGYESLMLEATYAHGRKSHFHRAPIAWRKNYPQTWLIQPGGSHEIQLGLTEGDWQGYPTQERPVRIRVVLDIPASLEARQQAVWTGKVESNSITTP